MCAAKCEDILNALMCICEGTATLAAKSDDTSQQIEGSFSDGVVSTGEGEQFPDQEAYFDAKCSVANGIFDTIRALAQWLDDNSVDLLAGLFGGVTSGLIVAVVASGPVGWTITLVGSTIVAVAGYLIRYSLEFADVVAVLDDTQEECVLSLYNAGDAITAEENFMSAVAAGSPVITTIEKGLLRIFLSSEMVNQLFSPREDVAVYESPSPVDCGAAILQVWDFDADFESWTFEDRSDPGSLATRSYDATAEGIENELTTQSAPNVTAAGGNISPTVALSIVPGSSIQVDYGPTSDPNNTRITVTAIYTDASEETNNVVFTDAGTIVLSLTQTKTLETVDVEFARSTSGSSIGTTSDVDLLEVRVVGL